MSATTRFTDPTLPEPPALYLALELSTRSWKLAFSTGHGQQPRLHNVPARDLDALIREIVLARIRFRLPDSAPLISCYEAGRDGFWIHRFLEAQPACFNLVVDSASIEVNRRRRRLKTDRIDGPIPRPAHLRAPSPLCLDLPLTGEWVPGTRAGWSPVGGCVRGPPCPHGPEPLQVPLPPR